MAGLGNSPFGTSPFGIGTPATLPDPISGLPGVRFLDPRSRDYQYDSTTGQLAQMPTVRQRVLLSLLTLRGSSTVLPEFGVELPKKIDQAFERRVKDSVRIALRQLTEIERLIRIDGILISNRGGGRVVVTVAYTHTNDGTTDQVSA